MLPAEVHRAASSCLAGPFLPTWRNSAYRERLSMPPALQRLPERQLEPLIKAYRDAVRAKRMQMALGFGLVLGLLGLALWTTQFDPLLLAANADRLSSYFVRIFHLENGALAWT